MINSSLFQSFEMILIFMNDYLMNEIIKHKENGLFQYPAEGIGCCPPGPSSIENDAHGIEKLLLKLK